MLSTAASAPDAGVKRSAGPGVHLERLVVGVFGLFGFRYGLRAISDNSMFLHLRTGIDMARSGHVPHSDPYSFTALHHAWVVQSWFAELLYGLAYRAGGLHLVIVEQAVLMAALGLLVATLARAGSMVRTMVSAGIAVFAGAPLWSQRPLLFGLLGLALVILIVERQWSPWWLLPVGWVWVNTHGSFLFGLGWLVAVAAGVAVQERRRPRELEPYIAAFIAALVLGMVNPVGPKLLTFPLVIQSKHKVFSSIIEWRSPNFQSGTLFVSLLFFGLALAVLIRRGAPWRDVLPFVGLLVLGLISVRNLAPAAVVVAPALGRAVRSPQEDPASTAPEPMPAGVRAIWTALALVVVIFVVGAYGSGGLSLRAYPVGAETYLHDHGLLDGRHIATQDFVGDYRELIEGRGRSGVFIDDRFDMYPTSVFDDYETLLTGSSRSPQVLARYDIQVVMWERKGQLPGLLELAGGWKAAYTDKDWVVLVRT